jgi:hypothetical protein
MIVCFAPLYIVGHKLSFNLKTVSEQVDSDVVISRINKVETMGKCVMGVEAGKETCWLH